MSVWHIVSKDDTKVIVVPGTSLCVDVYGMNKTSSAQIGLYQCAYTDNQLWYIKPEGNGLFSIMNKNSGMYLYINDSTFDVMQITDKVLWSFIKA
jgi:hypothetical protein